jgi:nanoRNase/pAp phosphatase (c-di-AMP/oligoRNAs hydrolase)
MDAAVQQKQNPQEQNGRKTYSSFIDFLEAHRGERHLVVLHDYPDPDAISSAFAHRLISAEFGIEVGIVYQGKISHQQNIALIRLLEMEPMLYIPTMDLRQYDGAVFIDNQGSTCKEIVEALDATSVPALAVIDHHERQDLLEPEFSDIRRVGATATIYAEYLESGLVELDRSDRTHVSIATGLMHGLLTDTQGFVRANEKDFRAAAFLSRYKDADLLLQIMSQVRSKKIMEIIQQALGNRIIVENFSMAGIGYLRAEDRDAIPQAADFLLSEENVHTAIVYGIVHSSDGSERLIGSLRTSKLTLGPDDFLKEVFGKDPDGRYFGGGKELAGGFEIPIGFLAGDHSEEYNQIKWQVYDRQIKQRLFAKIGVNHNGHEAPAPQAPNTEDTGPVLTRRGSR